MRLRKAVTSDASKLFSLEEELFLKENFPLTRNAFYYHIRNNLIYVAESNQEIVGYALSLRKRANAKIYSIGVSQKYRGQKIALKLLEKVLKELKNLGFKKVTLEVRVDNRAAILLYEKFGFQIKKISKEFYLDGCDANIMELNL